MIGRGAIGNPWIFERRERGDVSLSERLETIHDHLSRMVAFYGEKRGVLVFRKHIVRYTRGLPGASKLRPELMRCTTAEQVNEQLGRFLHPTENVL
jgi:tRNA-dihydrouridine synthase